MSEFLAISALIGVLALWVIHYLFLNRRLAQNQQRYHQFFDDSPVALIVIDHNYQITEWNQTAEAIFGWKGHEVIQKEILATIVPNFDKLHVTNILNKASLEGVSYSKNYNITKHGTEIFCEWRNRLIKGGKGGILCMAQDITAPQKTLDELNKRSTALESAGDAIFYTNEKGIIEFANKSFFTLNLNDQSQLHGTHIGIYLFNDRQKFNTILLSFDTDHTWRGTVSKYSDESEKVLSVTITAIYHRNRLISYIANLHDITQISSSLDLLNHRVQHDPLTGALNRAALFDRLNHAILRYRQTEQKIAIFFIDMNDFKIINDRYGHEAGDRLLHNVAYNIRACLRNSDTVCRFGGDEFIVMIEDVKHQEHLQTLKETIQAAIYEPIHLDNGTILYPHASIGIALYPDNATDAQELINAADTAMYEEKKNKKTNELSPILCADNHNR